MRLTSLTRSALLAATLGVSSLVGCGPETDSDDQDITDIKNTDVERQSIGNCWLYATASWVESMHLYRTGEQFDISQSYWTYWHWYGEIQDGWGDELSTGGSEHVSFGIIAERGLMDEADFITEDSVSEMSSRQSSALAKINTELKTGRLKDYEARQNKELVRDVLDEAWGLKPEVIQALDDTFGADGAQTFDGSASADGTTIIEPSAFDVQYPERKTDPSMATIKDTTLDVAVGEWRTSDYPSYGSNLDESRRALQIRVQKAMHDGAPVIITWMVDFNAMESSGDLRGSFNMTTLGSRGAGRQGGHMTVLEDYQAETLEYGLLAAGTTLDPSNEGDAAKLEAALLPSTKISFFRIKNSWGAFRDDRSSAPGMPGYHDLYVDYLNGPFAWCPSVEGAKTAENCRSTTAGFENVVMPPGY